MHVSVRDGRGAMGTFNCGSCVRSVLRRGELLDAIGFLESRSMIEVDDGRRWVIVKGGPVAIFSFAISRQFEDITDIRSLNPIQILATDAPHAARKPNG